jgi:hypothetical protein
MEAIEFVKAIRQAVIENDQNIYENLLNSIGDADDPIWRAISPVYSVLTKDQGQPF